MYVCVAAYLSVVPFLRASHKGEKERTRRNNKAQHDASYNTKRVLNTPVRPPREGGRAGKEAGSHLWLPRPNQAL